MKITVAAWLSACALVFASLVGPLMGILPVAVASTGCQPDIGISVLAGSPTGTGFVTYTITAHNLGTAGCKISAVTVSYAANEKFVSSSPALTRSNNYWKFGWIPADASKSVILMTYRTAPLVAGAPATQACFSASNGMESCSNAVATEPLVAGVNAPAPVPTTVPAPSSQKEFGLWQWTPLTQLSEAQMQTIVNNAAADHVNAIYQTIDDYIEIDQMAAGPTKTQSLASYENMVNEFLTLAAAKGIAVDGEAGASDWALSANTWKPQDIMSFVASYNQTHATSPKFRGVQYDIEPYSLSQYTTDPAGVLTQYAQLVESLAGSAKNDGLPLGLCVPFFYTASTGAPKITVDGITDYPYAQVVRLLNALPNGRILLMAYRNFAQGANGTIDISTEEIHTADGTHVSVIVGDETGPVTPSYVTFYGTTMNDLTTQMGCVAKAFANDSSYDGAAVDYYDYFIKLL